MRENLDLLFDIFKVKDFIAFNSKYISTLKRENISHFGMGFVSNVLLTYFMKYLKISTKQNTILSKFNTF